MSERAITKRIATYLKGLEGCWHFKVRGSAWQQAGVPDIVGVYRGRFFALEVKQPGNKPTVLQAAMLRQITAAGGIAAVVTSVEEARAALEGVG